MNDLETLLSNMGYGELEMLTAACDSCDFRPVMIYNRELKDMAGFDAEIHFYKAEDSRIGKESTIKAACLMVYYI